MFDGLIQSAFIYFSALLVVACATVVLCTRLRRAADTKIRPKARHRQGPVAAGSKLEHRTARNSAAAAPTARHVA